MEHEEQKQVLIAPSPTDRENMNDFWQSPLDEVRERIVRENPDATIGIIIKPNL
jgi:hypothetical protein